MKKTIAIFLILIFTINLFVSVLLFFIQKSEIQNEFRQYLKHSVSVNNLADAKWMGFTEPDPDGNCYQPGAGREFFGSLKVRF